MQPTFSLGCLETFQEVIPLSLALSPYVGKRRLTAKDWEAHHSTQHSAKLLHEKVSSTSVPISFTFCLVLLLHPLPFPIHLLPSTVHTPSPPHPPPTLNCPPPHPPPPPPPLPPPPPTPQLSHYLDIVEVHLAHEIAQKSDIFFDTLAFQQRMQKHVSHLRHEVMELRSALDHMMSHNLL